jgi:glutamate/tyrosine decarboxylase-like PLP-dependent enzyme
MFITKNASELYQVSGVSVKEMFREPYHYTFNNSRGAADIISAWNVLQSVGTQGFQSYIANMVNVANVFADELPS